MKAASFYSNVKLVLKYMAICWEVPPRWDDQQERLQWILKNPQIPYAVLHENG